MRHRDHLLLGAALLALVPGLAAPAHSADLPAPTRAAAAFDPPGEPLVLTRELRKGFGAAHEFVSRRRYEIRFVPERGGWRVDGTLIASEVDAPPGMAPQLAELERTRSDTGLFPIHLDAAGAILVQPGANDPAANARMLDAAQSVLASTGMASAERAAALELAAQLQVQARAAGGNWPEDLFHPAPGRHSESRKLALGGAGEGKVTVTIDAAGDPRGLLSRLQRRIITETAGSSRLSIETWTLSPTS